MKKLLLLLLFTVSTFAQVGINTSNPEAIFDIYSTTSGVLIPRLTTTERNAIVSPVNSMMIYNSTLNEFQYYLNTEWKILSSNYASASYKSYVAKLSQVGTQAPTVQVITNTLGFNITWSRNSIGKYFGTAPSNSFPQAKRYALVGTSSVGGGDALITNNSISATFNGMGTSGIIIRTGNAGILTDQILFETEIEIRIYN